MAIGGNIGISSEVLQEKASQFGAKAEEFQSLVSEMRNMVNALEEGWAGNAFSSFVAQFDGLEPSFNATRELITQIQQALINAEASYTEFDQQMANSGK
ncbi:MAG: WXG100 family type VII secretion target, partial [Eubacteriaceae bacterium]|jgi:WXG100 family type VII secretion target|nr:WXG100 family type VII secretion target [Eubacteriaceae bacterium]MDD4508478.1 WXG100 family type VII secretion target [Eubacteriaceae bacterium]